MSFHFNTIYNLKRISVVQYCNCPKFMDKYKYLRHINEWISTQEWNGTVKLG